MLKKVVFLSLAGPALLLALLLSPALAEDDSVAQDGTGQGNGELLDRVVALVNDDVITEQELASEVAMIKSQLRAQNTRIPADDVLKQQILDRMVLRHIQLQLAKKAHISVDDETLNRTLESIAQQNNLTLLAFRDVLEREGMQYTRFRENMRDEITINRLQKRQVNDRINITSQEVDAFLVNRALQTGTQYEYQLGHILISVPEAASPEAIANAREKAKKVVDELHAGADFAETAVAVSDGRQALEGGRLDWREASALPSLFADWVIGREIGAISDAIRSPSGFHIITLLDRRSNQPQLLVTQTHVRHILLRVDDPTRS
ncbi:Periplasmic chaperone and peptidyl-prolyl cis-trans isomerase of outer membrane proteins SurA, partial [hydrothermal vent metagenome]